MYSAFVKMTSRLEKLIPLSLCAVVIFFTRYIRPILIFKVKQGFQLFFMTLDNLWKKCISSFKKLRFPRALYEFKCKEFECVYLKQKLWKKILCLKIKRRRQLCRHLFSTCNWCTKRFTFMLLYSFFVYFVHIIFIK